MNKSWKVDGTIQLVLAVALVGVTIYSCRPASSDAAGKEHDAATCDVCSHPNGRRPGTSDVAHDLVLGAERHLRLCATCRDAGLTVDHMLAADTPTPCLVGDGEAIR